MNKCIYKGIQTFSYKKVKKTLTIKEQRLFFTDLVKKWVKKNPNKYPPWFLNEFVSWGDQGYWNMVPDEKVKTNYFLLPKKQHDKWSMGKRLADCKNRFYKYDKRWTSEPINKYKFDPNRHRIHNQEN